MELGIARAGGSGTLSLVPAAAPGPLRLRARRRDRGSPALVQVGEDHRPGRPRRRRTRHRRGAHRCRRRRCLDAVTPAQRFDDYAAIVEHAKARRAGREPHGAGRRSARTRAAALPGHDPLGRLQAGADDAGRGLKDAAKSRRVAAIEHAVAVLGAACTNSMCCVSVKQPQLAARWPAAASSAVTRASSPR